MTQPGLLLPHAAPDPCPAPADDARPSLVDLLYDGFYLIFLLRNGKSPNGSLIFSGQVTHFLAEFTDEARRHHHAPEDIHDAKYAFCALVDETVLSARNGIREEWQRRPLQLTLFGDQLAGEHFFDRLQTARDAGRARLPSLEVFHMCLLLGFKGRYLIEGTEKADYLSAQLGNQIAHLKGRHAPFAPHWRSPDSIAHRLRRRVPLWALLSLVVLAGVLGYAVFRSQLDARTSAELISYSGLIHYSHALPHFTITLP